MKTSKKILMIFAVGLLTITACKKDNINPTDPNNPNNPNNPPAGPSKTEILTQRAWKIQSTRMIEQGQNDTANVTIVGADQWRYSFSADGTGTATGTFLATQQNSNPPFNWVFTNNETKVSITPSSGGNALIYDFNEQTLKRVIPSITLTLIDGSGQPVGQVTGTLIETFERVAP
jgi:hypothetical protein